MKLRVKITISRNNHNAMSVHMRDELSGIEFARIELSPHDFCMALTGLAEVEGKLTCQGLEYVGKKRITEQRSIVCPLKSYTKREELSKWLEENAQEEGWLLISYLGCQSSVEYKDGKTILNYSVKKYIKPKEAT